jgi:hypothetical protein
VVVGFDHGLEDLDPSVGSRLRQPAEEQNAEAASLVCVRDGKADLGTAASRDEVHRVPHQVVACERGEPELRLGVRDRQPLGNLGDIGRSSEESEGLRFRRQPAVETGDGRFVLRRDRPHAQGGTVPEHECPFWRWRRAHGAARLSLRDRCRRLAAGLLRQQPRQSFGQGPRQRGGLLLADQLAGDEAERPGEGGSFGFVPDLAMLRLPGDEGVPRLGQPEQ